MRKALTVFLVLLLIIMIAVPVSANGPVPAPYYRISLTNLPEGTAYVDMLIFLPESSPLYTDLEAKNLPDNFSEDAQIITFSQDDYRSYTFHCRDAVSSIAVQRDNYVTFFGDDWDDEHNRYVSESGAIRLAMLDENGEILRVSGVLKLNPGNMFLISRNNCLYDGKMDHLEVGGMFDWLYFLSYLGISIFGLLMTCLAEWLIGIVFRFNSSNRGLIVKVNVVSQLLMRFMFAFLYQSVFRSYAVLTMVLEILIYGSEFAIYRKKMADVSVRKCIAYTITANTVSLLIGLYINRIFV